MPPHAPGRPIIVRERKTPVKVVPLTTLVLCICLCAATESPAQPRVGALAIDERQGDRYGWAVDYETTAAAQDAALRECGAGCSVVLTFGRCGAFAADQDAESTAVGWAESYASAEGARQTALAECHSRGGSGCVVRAWGCNGQVIEESLGLNRAARRQIQEGLRSAGFDPGGADGLFGPRTRAAIRNWQLSRDGRVTGYLDSAAAEALQSESARVGPATTTAATQVPPAVPAAQQPASGNTPSPTAPAAAPELEGLFWQSIMNSTNPAEFEAYLAQFPNGVFRALAQARLAALRAPAADPPEPAGTRVGGAGSRVSGGRASGTAAGSPVAAASDVGLRPGDVFRDCAVCPEMVVLPGARLALGRYEVTVWEYQAFASATGGGAAGGCGTSDNDGDWRDPGFPQTDRHPVTCLSWYDAQAYVSWLSRTTKARYRLPTEAEWERAALKSEPGCYDDRTGIRGTCPVGSYDSNEIGLSDMVGNLWEWTEDCYGNGCGRRVLRGGSWRSIAGDLRPGARGGSRRDADVRTNSAGFRVSRRLP